MLVLVHCLNSIPRTRAADWKIKTNVTIADQTMLICFLVYKGIVHFEFIKYIT